MSDLSQALGQKIIDGGLRRVAEDNLVYGSAAAVVVANGRINNTLHEMALKTQADVFRRSIATKFGEMAVSALYGGDIQEILQRGIADIARLAPIVEMQTRQAETVENEELQRKIASARQPAEGSTHAEQ